MHVEGEKGQESARLWRLPPLPPDDTPEKFQETPPQCRSVRVDNHPQPSNNQSTMRTDDDPKMKAILSHIITHGMTVKTDASGKCWWEWPEKEKKGGPFETIEDAALDALGHSPTAKAKPPVRMWVPTDEDYARALHGAFVLSQIIVIQDEGWTVELSKGHVKVSKGPSDKTFTLHLSDAPDRETPEKKMERLFKQVCTHISEKKREG